MKNQSFLGSINSILKNRQNIIPKSRTAKLYNELRDRFYLNKSHWSITECTKFVQNNKISPNQFLIFLEIIFTQHFIENKKHKRMAFKFLEALKASKRFNRLGKNNNSIKVETELKEFLGSMRKLKQNHLSTTHTEWIKFINRNFDTGHSRSYLERIYFDNKP